MVSLEIFNSVLPSHGRHEKTSKKKYRLDPPSVTSVCFGLCRPIIPTEIV